MRLHHHRHVQKWIRKLINLFAMLHARPPASLRLTACYEIQSYHFALDMLLKLRPLNNEFLT